MLVPAMRDSVLPIGAEVTVPAVAPPATEVADTYKIPLAAGAGTEMETLLAEIPTLAMPMPEIASTLFSVPVELLKVLAPDAVREMVLRFVTDGVVAEMVKLPLPAPMLTIPAPDTAITLLAVPLELDTVRPLALREIVLKFVTLGVVAEIVMLPAPTPIETMPAPERLRSVLNTPEDDPVVLPSAVIVTVPPPADTEIVIVLLACPMPMPAPAEMETLEELPFREKLMLTGKSVAEMVPLLL